MKKLIFLLIVMSFTLKACGQTETQTFTKPVYFDAGFYLGGKFYLQIPSGGSTDWLTITNKPLTFPPSVHNHDLLYKPLNWLPTWDEVQNKPVMKPLQDAIAELYGIKVRKMTTAEINGFTPEEGLIIYDVSLHAFKYWNGTLWRTIITGQ